MPERSPSTLRPFRLISRVAAVGLVFFLAISCFLWELQSEHNKSHASEELHSNRRYLRPLHQLLKLAPTEQPQSIPSEQNALNIAVLVLCYNR